MLTLMYITNREEIALIAQKAGVDRIWIDMEYIGKEQRQKGMDTVKSHHTIEDIKRLRPIINQSQLMVRVNPIHEREAGYMGTEAEIEATIQSGADVIMLPMAKTADEIKRFLDCVAGRAKTMFLLETAEAAGNLEEILKIEGLNEVHIGLNDLHLAYKKTFMFELLCDGTVDRLCSILRSSGVKYGFGGIARIGYGLLPAEYIIAEHYAKGSSIAILSRGFCNADRVEDVQMIEPLFIEGVKNIRKQELIVADYSVTEYAQNHLVVEEKVREIVNKIRLQRASL